MCLWSALHGLIQPIVVPNMQPSYPRDMIGYGAHPPEVNWPHKARIAVQFVLNYEEGGENNILHGDDASEAFLSEIVGAQPWQGQRHMNMESIYEYGSRRGFWRLYDLFSERNIPVTVFGVASAMQRNPDCVKAMLDARWEIATHGLKWIDYRNVPKETERDHIEQAIAIHQDLTGARPLGIYQGRTSENTLNLSMQEGGFLYSADSYADDLPYWVYGPHGPQLIVPIHLMPMICGLQRLKVSIRVTSFLLILRTVSTIFTQRVPKRQKCSRSGCIADWSGALVELRLWYAFLIIFNQFRMSGVQLAWI